MAHKNTFSSQAVDANGMIKIKDGEGSDLLEKGFLMQLKKKKRGVGIGGQANISLGQMASKLPSCYFWTFLKGRFFYI